MKRSLTSPLLLAGAALASAGLCAPQEPLDQSAKRKPRLINRPFVVSPELAAAMKEEGLLVDSFRKSFSQGNWDAARTTCERMLALNPKNELAACGLTDLLLREGKIFDAYRTITPFLNKEAQPKVLVRAALVAEMYKQPRAGLLEFCRSYLASNCSPKDLECSLPIVGSRNEALVISCLAVAVESTPNGDFDAWGSLYYGMALRLDPQNPFANYSLGAIEERAQHLDSAISHYKSALVRGGQSFRMAVPNRLRDIRVAREQIKGRKATDGQSG